MIKNNKKKFWRKLDNSAKIFPLQESNKYSTVFRYSVILKEKIDKQILEKAVEKALITYKVFKVKMKNGFFWYYLEENFKKTIIRQETNYPCKRINPRCNNDYLFSVTYFDNKINIEIFHSLTDGNGGLIFFKEIIYNYLKIKHKELDDNEERKARKIDYNTEDSYIVNYDKKSKKSKSEKNKRAYILKGIELKFNQVSVNHILIDVDDIKKECSKYNLSTTQYLTSVLIWSIYNANVLKYYSKNKRPIKICVPINLKKYYKSKTMSNFFSYISVDLEMNNCISFTEITKFVRREFDKKLTEPEILKTMSGNVKVGNNIIISFIPLFLKKIIIRSIFMEIQKYLSITYSNIGKIGILEKYQDYIDYFLLLIAPEHIEKIKCSSCTFLNKLAFTFTSVLNDNGIEKYFYEFLKAQNIKLKVESNKILDSIENGEYDDLPPKNKK